MALEDVARAHYTQQSTLTTRAGQAAAELWALLDPGALAKSWSDAELAQRLFTVLATFQVAAANAAPAYVASALAEQGAESDPQGVLDPRTLAGVASDGRPLESLVAQPLIQVLTAIQNGAQVADALRLGGSTLSMIAETQVADAGRAAEQVAMAVQPRVTGWIRMLVPPSCGRCAVLAGRFYRWNSGFRRHPRCDCRHIPASEDRPSLRTDPGKYFRSLSRADQGRYFTQAGAEAIRAGGDIGQVVNARRGAFGLTPPGRLTEAEQKILRGGGEKGYLQRVDVYGRQVYVTHEGTTRRGLAGQRLGAWSDPAPKDPSSRNRRARTPRLMPESILELAGEDRDELVRLLYRFGYIVNPPKATR